jgi:hypothetical protein
MGTNFNVLDTDFKCVRYLKTLFNYIVHIEFRITHILM